MLYVMGSRLIHMKYVRNHGTFKSSIILVFHVESSSSVFCPRAGPSLQTQGLRPQFCSKAGVPPQMQEPRLQFYYGRIGAVASRCFPHPTLSLASEQTLKDLKRYQGHKRGGEESGFG